MKNVASKSGHLFHAFFNLLISDGLLAPPQGIHELFWLLEIKQQTSIFGTSIITDILSIHVWHKKSFT